MTTVIPTIHLNGTSKQELMQGHLDALKGLRDAVHLMQLAAPHGRDYYPQGQEAIWQATEAHGARLERLYVTISELEAIAAGIIDQP